MGCPCQKKNEDFKDQLAQKLNPINSSVPPSTLSTPLTSTPNPIPTPVSQLSPRAQRAEARAIRIARRERRDRIRAIRESRGKK